jgi:esterase/lipase superfamily enzyme
MKISDGLVIIKNEWVMKYCHKKILIILLLISVLLSGCSWIGSKKDMFAELHAGANRNLVVVLPTIGGEGSHYEEQGLISIFREKGFEAHLKVLDVRPSLYLKSKIVELLKTEVINPAKSIGYKEIYLIGISLGGYGALQYVTKYPEDVDGVFVLAPFLGGPLIANAIEKAGGLSNLEECPFIAWQYACDMFLLIKNYTSHPGNRRRIILGYGTEDRFARQNHLLADVLEPDLVFTVQGGHDWETWKKLWIMALDYLVVLQSNHTDR